MSFTLTDLEKLEAAHAEVRPSAPAEIYQAFPAIAQALKHAWEENKTLQLRLDEALESEARLKDALRWSNKSIRDHVVTIDRQKQLIQSLTDCLSEAKQDKQ